MIKKILIFILLISIFGVGGYFFISDNMQHKISHLYTDTISSLSIDNRDTNNNENTISPKEIQTIYYTTTGYNPSRLQISLGDSVQFINQSNIPMWTASDPHPIHSDYNEFDSKRNYLSGEIYTYTFTKSGTFGRHNHSKSLHRGVVQVIDSTKPYIDIEKTRTEKGRKQRDELMKLLKPDNARDSIKLLFNTIKKSPKLVKDCHDMAHDFGHEAYELYGFSRAMTFDSPDIAPINDTDDLCAGGYMHGILEEAFLHDDDLQQNPGKICTPVPIKNQGSCYHGVGHGLMFNHKRDVKNSIKSCNLLPQQIQQKRCYEGVYMEMFWGSTGHADGYLGRDLNNLPTKACVGIPSEEEPACYLYAHLGYLRTHIHDYYGAINLCLQTEGMSEYGKGYCIKGIGITMMKSVGSVRLERTELFTKNIPQKYKNYYYQGVIGYALLSGMTKIKLKEICERMTKDQLVCLSIL